MIHLIASYHIVGCVKERLGRCELPKSIVASRPHRTDACVSEGKTGRLVVCLNPHVHQVAWRCESAPSLRRVKADVAKV